MRVASCFVLSCSTSYVCNGIALVVVVCLFIHCIESFAGS